MDYIGHARGEPLEMSAVESEHRDLNVSGHGRDTAGIGILVPEQQRERGAHPYLGFAFVIGAHESANPAVRMLEVVPSGFPFPRSLLRR